MTDDRLAQLARQASLLRDLHHRDRPLVLPNAWDVMSARTVEAAGFPVIATSSGAVAASFGVADDDSMPPELAFGVVDRISRAVDVPVTADLVAGFGLPGADVAERMLEAGAVGCNFEDTDHHGSGQLVPPEAHAARIADIKQRGRALGVDVVVNARIDVFRFSDDHAADVDAALERARVYADAGADCVYPIRLADEELIRRFVAGIDLPVNVMAPGAPPLGRLAELGVARVSFAGALFRASHERVEATLQEITSEITG